jgi:hypothetical protein
MNRSTFTTVLVGGTLVAVNAAFLAVNIYAAHRNKQTHHMLREAREQVTYARNQIAQEEGELLLHKIKQREWLISRYEGLPPCKPATSMYEPGTGDYPRLKGK